MDDERTKGQGDATGGPGENAAETQDAGGLSCSAEDWRELAEEIRKVGNEIDGKTDWEEDILTVDHSLVELLHHFAERVEEVGARTEARWAKANGELAHMLDCEKAQGGNAAAMREALLLVREWYLHDNADTGLEMLDNAIAALDAALAALPRNCDVGTADEQGLRFESWCAEQCDPCGYDMCAPCKLGDQSVICQLVWAQLPYAEKQERDDHAN